MHTRTNTHIIQLAQNVTHEYIIRTRLSLTDSQNRYMYADNHVQLCTVLFAETVADQIQPASRASGKRDFRCVWVE